MRIRLQILALPLCLTLLAWPLLVVPPASADCGLNNNGFEGGFTDRFGDGHVILANGWELWYQDGPQQNEGRNWRPTYRSESSSYLEGRRVHGGGSSQKFGNSYATHNAGILQRVNVPRGSQVTFSAWGLAWSSADEDTDSTANEGNYRLYVGIDPTGGTDWSAPSVRWSEPRTECNAWVQMAIKTQAEADAVTVFVRGQPEYPVPHNESCWDDLCLEVVKPAPPTNTPAPALSSLCVQSFDDKDGNGMRDEGEEMIPGASVTLLDAQAVEIAGFMTTDSTEPYCVQDLPLGNYTLKVSAPDGYESSQLAEQAVTVAEEPFKLELACRQLAAPILEPVAPPSTTEPTAVPAPTPDSGGGLFSTILQGIYNFSSVLIVLVVIGLLLASRYLRKGR